MNVRRKRVLQLAAVLAASVAVSGPVLSSPSYEYERLETAQVTRTIDITGYDLSSRIAAQRLYRRIVGLAKAICFKSSREFQGLERAKYERRHARPCFEAAVDDALAQVLASTGTDLEEASGLDRFYVAGFIASR